MKTKYNTYCQTEKTDSGKGYIQTYLQKEIDFLLASSANQLSQVEFNDIYIRNEHIEKFLEQLYQTSYSDRILYLTGLTGSGKTMVIRYVFQIHSLSPVVDNNTLIVPFSFDSLAKDGGEIKSVFYNMISNATDKLEEQFAGITHN